MGLESDRSGLGSLSATYELPDVGRVTSPPWASILSVNWGKDGPPKSQMVMRID